MVKIIDTYSFDSHMIRYRGTSSKGAFEGECIEGYGFQVVEGRTYIYGYRTVEPTDNHRWYRVNSDDITIEVISRRQCAARRRVNHTSYEDWRLSKEGD